MGSLFLYPVKTDRFGFLEPDLIRAGTTRTDYHVPPTKLLCIENTHNQSSGQPLTAEQTQVMSDAAREGGMSVHIDGARLFNASVSLGVDAADLAAPADSATFCLSKGLSCPIGSVVVGSEDFIDRARRWRKMLGAGMRQVGVVAAAGVYALENMIDRLSEDHINAKKLAEGLAEIDGISVDPRSGQVEHRLLQHPTRQRNLNFRRPQGSRHPSQRRRPRHAHGHPLRHLFRGY